MLAITTFFSVRLNKTETIMSVFPSNSTNEFVRETMEEYLTRIGHDKSDRTVYNSVHVSYTDTLSVTTVARDSIDLMFRGQPIIKEAYKVGATSFKY